MNVYIALPQVENQFGHCTTRDRREALIEIPAVSWPGTSPDMYWGMTLGDRGGTVVKVLCYKSEGRWLDPSLCQLIFH